MVLVALASMGANSALGLLRGTVAASFLRRHRVTAIFASHIHTCLETTFGRLPLYITGGAGAPLRGKSRSARQQNPYSKVFFSRLHYCLLEVRGESCTMKVLTPEGEVIDTRTWKARRPAPLPRPTRGPTLIIPPAKCPSASG